jgi:hypothetical protein
MNLLEKIFESTLWNTRLFILLPVIFSMIGAVALFVVASFDIFHVTAYTVEILSSHQHPANFHEKVVGDIIGKDPLGKRLAGVVIDPAVDGLAGIVADQAGHLDAARPGQAETLLKVGCAVHELPGPALERADRIGQGDRVRPGQAGFHAGDDRSPVPWSAAGLHRFRDG